MLNMLATARQRPTLTRLITSAAACCFSAIVFADTPGPATILLKADTEIDYNRTKKLIEGYWDHGVIEEHKWSLMRLEEQYCSEENFPRASADAIRNSLKDLPFGKSFLTHVPLGLFSSKYPDSIIKLNELADRHPSLKEEYLKSLRTFTIAEIINSDVSRRTPEEKWAMSLEVTYNCSTAMTALGFAGESEYFEQAIDTAIAFMESRI